MSPKRTAGHGASVGRRPTGGIRWLSSHDIILDHADVVVVGAGATGIGVLWDLSLRGLNVVLLEQAGLASGTSGAFHGLLHSGGRYAGSDPLTAAECLEENRILRQVAKPFVSDTGGLFVRLPDDDPAWERRWLEGCRAAGIATTPVPRERVLAREPRLSRELASAYRVPDAAVDGFGLLWSMLWSAAEAGARVYFRAKVSGFLSDEHGVRGVRLTGLGGTEDEAAAAAASDASPSTETGEITAGVVVNATGPWAADTAGLAGRAAAQAVPVERDQGAMLILNSRLVTTVVNRLRTPSDGDILVPHGPVTILGTTSRRSRGAHHLEARPEDVRRLVDEGRALVPGLDGVAPLRAYAGVRPLLISQTGRGGGRGFLLIDHGDCGGPRGLVTVAGGKFTTFRAMAEATGDLVGRLLGRRTACRTREVGIRRLTHSPFAVAAGRPMDRSHALAQPLICECELVDQPQALSLLDTGLGPVDLRRLSRLGMGGCQGVFCAQRLAGALTEVGWPGNRGRPRPDAALVAAETEAFRRGRLSGVAAVQWGSQARLSAVATALDGLTLGRAAETAPPSPEARPGEGDS